jgi:hypothetical protein
VRRHLRFLIPYDWGILVCGTVKRSERPTLVNVTREIDSFGHTILMLQRVIDASEKHPIPAD